MVEDLTGTWPVDFFRKVGEDRHSKDVYKKANVVLSQKMDPDTK